MGQRILQAQKLLPKVTIKEDYLRIVARMCIELDVDGHRPDIIITRAAMTKAAYDGRKQVSEEDMVFASGLTLGFRMRRTPFEEAAWAKNGSSRSWTTQKSWRRKRKKTNGNQEFTTKRARKRLKAKDKKLSPHPTPLPTGRGLTIASSPLRERIEVRRGSKYLHPEKVNLQPVTCNSIINHDNLRLSASQILIFIEV